MTDFLSIPHAVIVVAPVVALAIGIAVSLLVALKIVLPTVKLWFGEAREDTKKFVKDELKALKNTIVQDRVYFKDRLDSFSEPPTADAIIDKMGGEKFVDMKAKIPGLSLMGYSAFAVYEQMEHNLPVMALRMGYMMIDPDKMSEEEYLTAEAATEFKKVGRVLREKYKEMAYGQLGAITQQAQKDAVGDVEDFTEMISDMDEEGLIHADPALKKMSGLIDLAEESGYLEKKGWSRTDAWSKIQKAEKILQTFSGKSLSEFWRPNSGLGGSTAKRLTSGKGPAI